MDIKRKSVTKEKKSLGHTHLEYQEPQFSFDLLKNTESIAVPKREPYHLGEEQLWYQEPQFPEPIALQAPEEEMPVFHPKAVPTIQQKRWRPKFGWPGLPRAPRLKVKGLVIAFGVLLLLLSGYGLIMKSALEDTVELGMENTQKGIDKLGQKDFPEARKYFLAAENNFRVARMQTLYFPAFLAKPLTIIPGVSRVASGVLAVDASSHLVQAALEGTTVAETIVQSRSKVEQGQPVSYLVMLGKLELPLKDIRNELKQASSSLGAIPERDIPEDQRFTLTLMQKSLPGIVGGIDSFLANAPLVEELLGKNGPRTYLFLFQNNQELRPTGGFIGTYGILEFKDGHARRFFIDGIFNPDGQLRENIIPPKPIQKISAGWSLHDSNWFPDFPTSAEKAIFFYEKTGGPTVDGVFTLTPTVMERLLALTGPIELPEYDMTVDSNNFIPTIQEQVEVKYDRTENKPKKVLSDLASILMERVFALTDPLALYQVANVLVDGMNEKQILLYTRNDETEKLIEEAGWSGKIDASKHDYVSVINTNVNGYKTDGVIKDAVEHTVTVQDDGTLLAKTKITRVHTGGNTPYDWWNRVNSDYMRVYVPAGSKLITATGHTREFPPEPLDYKALGFKEDATVAKEEKAILIDADTGTRVGEEFGKTVFGNWVYVSPGETVAVEYTYLLPFRLDPNQKESSGYSLLFQKQPGVDEVEFRSTLEYPKDWRVYWQSGTDLQPVGESGIQLERTLRTDAFWGVVFNN